MLREGEEIEITKRRQVVARLVPAQPPAKPKMPDFRALQKKIWGDKKMQVSGAELLARERERF